MNHESQMTSGALAPRGFDESLEERPELPRAPEVLRVPLHAEAEALRGILDGLDDAVRRGGGRDEPFAERLRRLMVTAVHGAGVALFDPLPHQLFEQAARRHPDVVSEREARLAQIVLLGVADLAGDVLDERAAARDVQYLD